MSQRPLTFSLAEKMEAFKRPPLQSLWRRGWKLSIVYCTGSPDEIVFQLEKVAQLLGKDSGLILIIYQNCLSLAFDTTLHNFRNLKYAISLWIKKSTRQTYYQKTAPEFFYPKSRDTILLTGSVFILCMSTYIPTTAFIQVGPSQLSRLSFSAWLFSPYSIHTSHNATAGRQRERCLGVIPTQSTLTPSPPHPPTPS
jgi:hypothetical protein